MSQLPIGCLTLSQISNHWLFELALWMVQQAHWFNARDRNTPGFSLMVVYGPSRQPIWDGLQMSFGGWKQILENVRVNTAMCV
jgi:hypothetical protein